MAQFIPRGTAATEPDIPHGIKGFREHGRRVLKLAATVLTCFDNVLPQKESSATTGK
jgi:hypothetical protein